MTFDELVAYIKQQGCRVILYRNKREFKISRCTASFECSNGPVITMAMKGRSQVKLRSILLHEFAHFVQWKLGTLEYLDGICDGWTILDEWLDGKEISQEILDVARKVCLAVEYDAELITIELADKLDIDIGGVDKYLKAIESYILLIKYAFYARKFPYGAAYKYFKGKLLTMDELFAPICDAEIEIMKRVKG